MPGDVEQKPDQMLEHLEYLVVLRYNLTIDMPSEKLSSADNQQESLVWWIVGFTDGEGTFSVSLNRNHTTSSGWQIFPEYVVTQGERSLQALEEMQNFFQCGKIYPNHRYDNHHEILYRYCVRSIKDLKSIIIPFFQKHPLKTAKRNDFLAFAAIVDLMDQGLHRSKEGFDSIRQLASTMNRRSSRWSSSETIRQGQ